VDPLPPPTTPRKGNGFFSPKFGNKHRSSIFREPASASPNLAILGKKKKVTWVLEPTLIPSGGEAEAAPRERPRKRMLLLKLVTRGEVGHSTHKP
jgi:hypothetical protein